MARPAAARTHARVVASTRACSAALDRTRRTCVRHGDHMPDNDDDACMSMTTAVDRR
jgi:hypothetical protein